MKIRFGLTFLFLLLTKLLLAQLENGKYDAIAVESHLVGVEYYFANDFEKAIQYFSKSINLDSSIAENFISRGNSYKKLKEYRLSEIDFVYVVNHWPDLAYQAYNNLGNIYMNQNDVNRAIQFYILSLDANYLCFDCYYNLGQAYSSIKNYELAKQIYETAIKLDYSDANCLYNLGNTYFQLKEYKMAIKAYNVASMNNPSNMQEIYFNRGLAYAKLENYERAKGDFESFVEQNKNNKDAYYNLALSCFRIDDFKCSCSNAKNAVRLGHVEGEIFVKAACNK